MRRGGSFALSAAAGLMLAGLPGIGAATTPATIFVTICGDPNYLIALPMMGDDRERHPCSTGCHAMCARREVDLDEE